MDEPIITEAIDDLLTHIPPEHLARWKKRYPIHWRDILEVLIDGEIIQRHGANPKHRLLACYRTWDLMLSMYDLASPTERVKQGWRRSIRELLAEHPIVEDVYPSFRWRLNEHDHLVRSGMEDGDPDEIERGRNAYAQ